MMVVRCIGHEKCFVVNDVRTEVLVELVVGHEVAQLWHKLIDCIVDEIIEFVAQLGVPNAQFVNVTLETATDDKRRVVSGNLKIAVLAVDLSAIDQDFHHVVGADERELRPFSRGQGCILRALRTASSNYFNGLRRAGQDF